MPWVSHDRKATTNSQQMERCLKRAQRARHLRGNLVLRTGQVTEVEEDGALPSRHMLRHLCVTAEVALQLLIEPCRQQPRLGCLQSLRLNIKGVHAACAPDSLRQPQAIIPIASGGINNTVTRLNQGAQVQGNKLENTHDNKTRFII